MADGVLDGTLQLRERGPLRAQGALGFRGDGTLGFRGGRAVGFRGGLAARKKLGGDRRPVFENVAAMSVSSWHIAGRMAASNRNATGRGGAVGAASRGRPVMGVTASHSTLSTPSKERWAIELGAAAIGKSGSSTYPSSNSSTNFSRCMGMVE